MLSHYISYTKHSKYFNDLEEVDFSQKYGGGGGGVEEIGIKTRPVGGAKKGHIRTKFSLWDDDGTSESG